MVYMPEQGCPLCDMDLDPRYYPYCSEQCKYDDMYWDDENDYLVDCD